MAQANTLLLGAKGLTREHKENKKVKVFCGKDSVDGQESRTPLCDRALRDAEQRQALDRCTEVAEDMGLPD